MDQQTKKAQLQIRVTKTEKAAIHQAATRAGMDMSAYVLSRVLSEVSARFQNAWRSAPALHRRVFALAELNSLLSS